ncbi:MAG: hypothetical protein AAGF11_07310 [Myxococcota bacterium]
MNKRSPRGVIPPVLFVLIGLAACAEPERFERASGEEGTMETGDPDDPDDPEVDEDAILAQAMAYEQELTLLTPEPELSETHSDAASVRVWGSSSAAELFSSIDPDDPTQEVSFAEGDMFVKEHFDEAGEVNGLTVMFKGPEGYDPDARDWYWARIRGDELTHSGRVQWCIDCHEAAFNSDLVVGFGKSP